MTNFISTRNSNNIVTCKEAIIKGLASDGGLFVPDTIKKIDLNKLRGLNYQDLAYIVISNIFDDLNQDMLAGVIKEAYGDNFVDKQITPLHKVNGKYFLDLAKGPTSAFKDIALQFLPRIMQSLNNDDKDIVILTATSGDTGKAALEGFKNLKGTKIKVLYPYQMVSAIQERQMITTDGDNTEVLAVKGNFDDCQRMVKDILENEHFDNIHLSSANSINIARLIPQCVYYFKAYITLLDKQEIKEDEPVDFVVPTGNFGDILAGYLAKLMGLPINKLVIASNMNNVLTDFYNTGVYNANRQLCNSMSPSIDILISSNLERLLYLLTSDSELVSNLMNDLRLNRKYRISEELFNKLHDNFLAYDASEIECQKVIKEYYDNYNFLIDPHTSVALVASDKYHSFYKQIILSTASPFKFSKDVYYSLTHENVDDNLEAMNILSAYTNNDIPSNLFKLKDLPVIHAQVIDKEDKNIVIEKLKEL